MTCPMLAAGLVGATGGVVISAVLLVVFEP